MTAALFVVAALLGMIWLGLLAWALFGDRPRARRRCPKCFYELDLASGLKCSECGHEAGNERDLARTHRHWPRAGVATLFVLVPALGTGVFARVQQGGGWSDLPSGAVTRLLWINNEGLHADAISRIGRGELDRSQAKRVVLAACDLLESRSAQRRQSGFALLNKVARNSYVLTNDRPQAQRPMLEELRPDVSVPILLRMAKGEDAGDAQSAIALLGRLCDVDDEVVLTILRAIADDDATMAAAAVSSLSKTWRAGEIVRRLPFSPHTSSRWYRLPNGLNGEAVLTSFSREIAAKDNDRASLLAWTRPVAEGRDEVSEDIKAETDLDGRRAMALWLLCRLDGYGESAWSAVEQAAGHDSQLLRIAAIAQVSGFEWSDEAEALLRAALASDDTATTAQDVAARFGTDASVLLPDFLTSVSKVDRTSSTSAMPKKYIALGGDPRVLHDAIVHRLDTILRDWPERILGGSGYTGSFTPISVTMDLWWLADLGIEDERAADLMLAYMESEQGDEAELSAAIAYAAITGDKTLATRTILASDPDLSQPLVTVSPQYKLWDLIRRDLADTDLIQSHYVDTDNAQRRAGFADLMARFSYREIVQRFEPALRTLQDDPDPGTAAAALKALQALDD